MGELRLPELGDRYNAAETYVDAHRAERPDKVAIRCQGASVTYGEMAASVDRCGNALRELGVDIEDRVVILCLDSPAFVYTFFGAIKLGAIPVPANTLLIARDLAYILRDSRAVAIVVSAPLLPKVLEVRKQCPRLRHILVTASGTAPLERPLPEGVSSFEEALAAAGDELDPADTTPDDMCFWLYSSGTTGFPKGAVHLQHDMIYSAETLGRHVLGCTEDDRYFTVSPLFHAYGLGNGVFVPMRYGASVVYKPERATPDLVYGLVTTERPTVMYTAPTFYAALLAYPEADFKYDLSSLRFCVSAGEALPKPLFDAWKKRFGIEILDGIGSTEMLHIFICNRPGQARGGTSGTVVPGYRAKIVDDDGRDLGAGRDREPLGVGRLVLRLLLEQAREIESDVPRRMDGHRRQVPPGHRRLLHVRGPLPTTCSRSRGSGCRRRRSRPRSSSTPRSSNAASSARRTRTSSSSLAPSCCSSRASEPSDALAEELKQFVKAKIAPYKYPRWIVFVDELPKTATGKIQRFKLRELDGG